GYPVVMRGVTPGSPAANAGLQPGDRIVMVGVDSVKSAAQVKGFIRDHKDQQLPFTIVRNNETRKLTIGSERLSGGLIGVLLADDFPVYRARPVTSLRYAVDQNIRIVKLTGKALGQVFAGKRSVRNTVSGPIGIYQV